MQSERDTRDDVSRSRRLLDSFQGFGSRRSMFPSLFGGRDPFGDPFFSRSIGSIFESSMFGPSSGSSDTPESGRANKISVEELNSDVEGGEDKVTMDERDNIGKQSVSGKEPSIEHPDDVCNFNVIRRAYQQRNAACKSMPISIRCEQSTKEGGLDVWLGRLAMIGFAVAIGIDVSTGKGLLENFGLTSPLPTAALGVIALVGVLTAVFIFQSGSKK